MTSLSFQGYSNLSLLAVVFGTLCFSTFEKCAAALVGPFSAAYLQSVHALPLNVSCISHGVCVGSKTTVIRLVNIPL